MASFIKKSNKMPSSSKGDFGNGVPVLVMRDTMGTKTMQLDNYLKCMLEIADKVLVI